MGLRGSPLFAYCAACRRRLILAVCHNRIALTDRVAVPRGVFAFLIQPLLRLTQGFGTPNPPMTSAFSDYTRYYMETL